MGNWKQTASPHVDPGAIYEIRVMGCRDEFFWTDWFGGMQVDGDEAQGETTLRGPLADQAELYGLLTRLRNNGLTLISFKQILSC